MSKELSIFFSGGDAFSESQRVAKALTQSTLVPQEYQRNLSNTLVALDMAQRMKMNPLMVMQNLHIIHGKPGWSSKSLIAMFNQCGRFGPLRYKATDTSCYAYAKDLESGEDIEGPIVTMDIAKAEGWLSKKGSKWQTMPALMLRYRAASWFINTVAPDISFGLNTEDEIEDARGYDSARDVTPQQAPASLLNDIIPPEQNAQESQVEVQQMGEVDVFGDDQ